MNFGNFPKADCGRFWILASTHVDQPKSTEKLNKAILLNLNCSMTGLYLGADIKGVASSAQGPKLGERPSAEMSSVQALMELALPRFTMAEGPRVKHPPWPVAVEAPAMPASPSPNQIEPRGEDSRYSCNQSSFQSVYFDLDALASSSDEESVDVKKCKDLSVTVLYKSEEADTLAKSEMAVSDSDCLAVSELRDVRKVVRRRDGPLCGPAKIPARPDFGTKIGPSNRKVQARESV